MVADVSNAICVIVVVLLERVIGQGREAIEPNPWSVSIAFDEGEYIPDSQTFLNADALCISMWSG